MKKTLGVAGLFSVLSIVSCGDERPDVIDEGGGKPSGGRGGKSGGGASNDGGGDEGGAGGEGSGGEVAMKSELQVAITAPPPAGDPNEDEVLVGSQVDVLCTALASVAGQPVNPATVKVALLDQEGAVLAGVDDKPIEKVATPTGEPDEYLATLPLTTAPSGPVSFRCTAEGIDAAIKGAATIDSLVDHGPTIVGKLPAVAAAHTLAGALQVEFTVAPTPLTDDDEEAGVTAVKLFVAGVEIDAVEEDDASPGTWRASVNFQDLSLFPEPPMEHTSVRIEATNGRTEQAATAVLDYPFVVDGKKPVISVKSPGQNAAVKGETTVEFTVTDSGAGVDPNLVEVSLNSQAPIKYSPADTTRWERDKDTYRFRFDTGQLGELSAQITVDISATDKAGNVENGGSRFLWLDNVAPVVDLDPGNWRLKTGSACSRSFDPLGTALNDGAIIGSFAKLRALVFDETKYTGQSIMYPSLANQASVRLYATTATSQPFLISKRKDGVCDSLADGAFPFKSLSPVSIQGAALSALDGDTPPAVTSDICSLRPPASPVPTTLCSGLSDMHVVVQHDVKQIMQNEPVVYAMGVTALTCTGGDWDPLTIDPTYQGWICYAATAADKLGNVGWSRPLRICYDNPNVAGAPECATSSQEPPSCTDGCTAPAFPAHLQR